MKTELSLALITCAMLASAANVYAAPKTSNRRVVQVRALCQDKDTRIMMIRELMNTKDGRQEMARMLQHEGDNEFRS